MAAHKRMEIKTHADARTQLLWNGCLCPACVAALWQSSLHCSALPRRTGGITGIVFTPVCKSSQWLHQLCSWFVLSSLRGGCTKNISQSDSFSITFEVGGGGWGIVHWELFEPWIFVRSPHQYFNTLWYGSARIGKQSLPPPYTCSLDEFPSLQLWYGCPMRIQFIFVAISEFLCVKIRLPNTSPPAVSNLPQYDSLTRFRAAIDLWSTPSRLTRCRTGSPINCAPINHGSPMFVCSTLWYG